ncbi:hypothetical protein NEF87_001783 [Candidatus Lokiarchaeum ossiferum]|uniref:Uncharacterized protein n=1 Tax=Candidatus Lokiarchaeum ossiferum TaxID=2951803 RepID=A0ABY6HQ84_9ARCH|nr:hypothetical protein NEF87_001783 [Candidatus Lokiarchaeum sp. B-35]
MWQTGTLTQVLLVAFGGFIYIIFIDNLPMCI